MIATGKRAVMHDRILSDCIYPLSSIRTELGMTSMVELRNCIATIIRNESKMILHELSSAGIAKPRIQCKPSHLRE